MTTSCLWACFTPPRLTGFSLNVARWVVTNLRSESSYGKGNFSWTFALNGIAELYRWVGCGRALECGWVVVVRLFPGLVLVAGDAEHTNQRPSF